MRISLPDLTNTAWIDSASAGRRVHLSYRSAGDSVDYQHLRSPADAAATLLRRLCGCGVHGGYSDVRAEAPWKRETRGRASITLPFARNVEFSIA